MSDLILYKVSLHEHKDDKFTLFFYCSAEDEDHAEEQALNAYPDGEILNVLKFIGEEYPYTISQK